MQSQAMKRGGGHQSGYEDVYDDYQAPRGQSYDADAHQYWLDQQRYAAAVEEQQYDPRFYAPNPDEPYAWDEDGNPLFYAPAKQEPRSSSRGMLMLGAVFAVAVLGAGGLFAYKLLGGKGLSGEPPLIRADAEPVKTTPEPAVANGEARSKAVYDRVDDAKRASKVVSREEQPVDLPAAPSAAPRHDGSRVILPGGERAAAAPATGGDEPRRVKTMTIRPDGEIAAAEPYQAPAASRPPVEDPIAQLARTGQVSTSEFDNGIMAGAEPGKPAPKPAAQPQVAQRSAVPAPAPAAQRPAAAQPVVQAPKPAPQQQVASVTPRAPAPAPATPAAAPARATTGGGFVVQVTSQRSEGDARTAYASLQKKFPQVLGAYQASIQPATVPERGTYYRVRVGPFTSSNDASTLCTNLRSAGGDCVVSRN